MNKLLDETGLRKYTELLKGRMDTKLDKSSYQVDNELSTESENPVQNKIITEKINSLILADDPIEYVDALPVTDIQNKIYCVGTQYYMGRRETQNFVQIANQSDITFLKSVKQDKNLTDAMTVGSEFNDDAVVTTTVEQTLTALNNKKQNITLTEEKTIGSELDDDAVTADKVEPYIDAVNEKKQNTVLAAEFVASTKPELTAHTVEDALAALNEAALNPELDNITVNQNGTFRGNVGIAGNLYVEGTMTTVASTQVNTSDDYVVVRDGNDTPLQPGKFAGLVVNNYKGDGKIATITADANGIWRISDSSDTESTTFTNISAFNHVFYEGLSRVVIPNGPVDIVTDASGDEFTHCAFKSDAVSIDSWSDGINWYDANCIQIQEPDGTPEPAIPVGTVRFDNTTMYVCNSFTDTWFDGTDFLSSTLAPASTPAGVRYASNNIGNVKKSTSSGNYYNIVDLKRCWTDGTQFYDYDMSIIALPAGTRFSSTNIGTMRYSTTAAKYYKEDGGSYYEVTGFSSTGIVSSGTPETSATIIAELVAATDIPVSYVGYMEAYAATALSPIAITYNSVAETNILVLNELVSADNISILYVKYADCWNVTDFTTSTINVGTQEDNTAILAALAVAAPVTINYIRYVSAGKYYHRIGNKWYGPVVLSVNNELTDGSEVDDPALIAELNTLPQSTLLYWRTITNKKIINNDNTATVTHDAWYDGAQYYGSSTDMIQEPAGTPGPFVSIGQARVFNNTFYKVVEDTFWSIGTMTVDSTGAAYSPVIGFNLVEDEVGTVRLNGTTGYLRNTYDWYTDGNGTWYDKDLNPATVEGTSISSLIPINNIYNVGYVTVTPVGDEDPTAEGWYEWNGTAFVLSTDTTVDATKTYYVVGNKFVVHKDVYETVVPVGDEDPATEGWYEYDVNTETYFLTADTTVDPTKVYYKKYEYAYITALSGADIITGDGIDDAALIAVLQATAFYYQQTVKYYNVVEYTSTGITAGTEETDTDVIIALEAADDKKVTYIETLKANKVLKFTSSDMLVSAAYSTNSTVCAALKAETPVTIMYRQYEETVTVINNQALLTRDEESNLTDNALLAWYAANRTAKTINFVDYISNYTSRIYEGEGSLVNNTANINCILPSGYVYKKADIFVVQLKVNDSWMYSKDTVLTFNINTVVLNVTLPKDITLFKGNTYLCVLQDGCIVIDCPQTPVVYKSSTVAVLKADGTIENCTFDTPANYTFNDNDIYMLRFTVESNMYMGTTLNLNGYQVQLMDNYAPSKAKEYHMCIFGGTVSTNMPMPTFNAAWPIGSTYTQYPQQKSPNELFGSYSTWEEIDYGGAFFRASGGGAEAFIEEGETLQMQAQQLLSHKHNDAGHGHRYSDRYMVYGGGDDGGDGNHQNNGAYRYPNTDNGYANITNAVTYDSAIPVTTGAENRPANYTKRIWVRVS